MRVDVVIIGAGIAGLGCAQELRKKRPDLSVVVLEANKYHVGGRIRSFCDHPKLAPIHLGAELIHGTSTSLSQVLEEHDIAHRQVFQWAHGDGGPSPEPVNGTRGYYYDGSTGTLHGHDSKDPDFVRLNEAIDEIADVDPRDYPAGTTIRGYLESRGVSGSMLEMGDRGYANTLCGSAGRMPLKETVDIETVWLAEDEEDIDLKVDGSNQVLIDVLRDGVKVVHGFVVKKVTYGSGSLRDHGCTVESEGGDVVECRAVVSAVPVSAYKRRLIDFNPPLASGRMEVMDKIVFEPAMKAFFRFKEAFWPTDAIGVICAGTPIPEFWFQPRLARDSRSDDPAEHAGNDYPPFIATAFACSDNARRLGTVPDRIFVETALTQLNKMFGTKDDPRPAHRAYDSFVCYNWSDAEYVWGGYTSPSPGVSMEDRDLIAAPISGRLFFAGEHASRSYMCMHGAMDSGVRAAGEVSEALRVKARV